MGKLFKVFFSSVMGSGGDLLWSDRLEVFLLSSLLELGGRRKRTVYHN